MSRGKTPLSILDKLIDSAIMRRMCEWGMRPKRGKPGELVLALSDEDRKILEGLEAEHMLNRRTDLVEIGFNDERSQKS